MVRSVQTGADPTDTYVNLRADGISFENNTALGIGANFQSSIIDTNGYTQFALELLSDQTGTLTGEWYSDSNGDNVLRSFVLPYNTTGNLLANSSQIFSRYVKFTYVNGDTEQSNFYIQFRLLTKAVSGQTLSLESTIVDAMIANLGINVTVGKQPDGDYVNTPADGSAFATQTLLGANQLNGSLNSSDTTITVDSTSDFPSSGAISIDDELITYTGTNATTFTGCTRGAENTTAASHDDNSIVSGVYISDWRDTDGWNSIECFFHSDVASKSLGIYIEFTEDANADTPVVQATRKFTFDSSDVDRGFKDFHIRPILDGFRFIYVNGNTTQTEFLVDATLKVNSENLLFNNGQALQTGDFLTEVAFGNISNFEIATKFGRRENIDTGTDPADIWEGPTQTYTGQPKNHTPGTIQVLSSDTNDTSAGTGARTMRIIGLRSNTSQAYESEDFILNGTTAVNSVNTWWRVNRAYILTAGDTEDDNGIIDGNIGTITVRDQSDNTIVFATIQPRINQSNITGYTVPLSVKCIIKRLNITIINDSFSNETASLSFRVREPGGVFRTRLSFDIQNGGIIDDRFEGGIVIDQGSDIKVRVDTVRNDNTIVNASYEYVLEAI